MDTLEWSLPACSAMLPPCGYPGRGGRRVSRAVRQREHGGTAQRPPCHLIHDPWDLINDELDSEGEGWVGLGGGRRVKSSRRPRPERLPPIRESDPFSTPQRLQIP